MVKIVVHTDGDAMHRCTVDINRPPPELIEVTRHALYDMTKWTMLSQHTGEGDDMAATVLKKILERMAR